MNRFDLNQKIILITGATSGIGRATAFACLELGAKVIVTGRREAKLEEFTEKFPKNTLAKSFDIRNLEEVTNFYQSLPQDWKAIDILVNNAGLSRGLNKFQDGQLADWEEMIDTNLKGLLYISQQLIPGMIERGQGHIVNLGSIAGHQAYPGGNVYCATKAAVSSLTQSLRMDLLGSNIRVSSIDPGMVETEFSVVRFKGDIEKAKSVYLGLQPLSAEDIADAIIYTITRPKHVNIQEMLIMPTAQASATLSFRK